MGENLGVEKLVWIIVCVIGYFFSSSVFSFFYTKMKNVSIRPILNGNISSQKIFILIYISSVILHFLLNLFKNDTENNSRFHECETSKKNKLLCRGNFS